jgi:hypothetical protein
MTEFGCGLSLLRTRKASPIIQAGSVSVPRHSVEVEVVREKAKSAGLVDQVDPPNDSSTLTVVEHANYDLSNLPCNVCKMYLR